MSNKKVAAGFGIGCLVLLIAVVIGGVFLFKKGKEAIGGAMEEQKARAELAATWNAPAEFTEATLAPATIGNASMANYQEITEVSTYGIQVAGHQITYKDGGTTYQVYILPNPGSYKDELSTYLESKSNRSQMDIPPVMTYKTNPPRENGAVFTKGISIHASADADVDVYPWLAEYLKAVSVGAQ